jgi:hypothetical protein
MKIKHYQAQRMLGDYAACEVDETTIVAIESHLNMCQRCRRELAEIRPLRAMLRQLSSSDALENLATALPVPSLPELHGGMYIPGNIPVQNRVRSRQSWLVVLIAALALFVFGISLFTSLFSIFHPGATPIENQPTPTVIPTCASTSSVVGDVSTPTPPPSISGVGPTPTSALFTPGENALTPTPTPSSNGICGTIPPTKTPTPASTRREAPASGSTLAIVPDVVNTGLNSPPVL